MTAELIPMMPSNSSCSLDGWLMTPRIALIARVSPHPFPLDFMTAGNPVQFLPQVSICHLMCAESH